MNMNKKKQIDNAIIELENAFLKDLNYVCSFYPMMELILGDKNLNEKQKIKKINNILKGRKLKKTVKEYSE